MPLRLIVLATAFLPDLSPVTRFRGLLVRPFIGCAGRDFALGRDVTILSPWSLDVGDRVYFAKGVWLNAAAGLTVGDDVDFGPYVTISTLNHIQGAEGRVAEAESVAIGSNVWLGSKVTVGAGATITDGCVVGANSVVPRRGCPEPGLYVGIPAQRRGAVRTKAQLRNAPFAGRASHEVKPK